MDLITLLVVITWLMANVVAVVFSAIGIVDGSSDVITCRLAGIKDNRLLFARSYLRAQSLHFTASLMFTTAGIIGAVSPQQSAPVTTQAQWIRVLLVLPVVTIAINTVLNWRVRHQTANFGVPTKDA